MTLEQWVLLCDRHRKLDPMTSFERRIFEAIHKAPGITDAQIAAQLRKAQNAVSAGTLRLCRKGWIAVNLQHGGYEVTK